MTTKLPTCTDCGHLFDPADQRASLVLAECPLCHVMARASLRWGYRNDCNGVFDHETFYDRTDAVAAMGKELGDHADNQVVPVVVVEVPKNTRAWERAHREAKERAE